MKNFNQNIDNPINIDTINMRTKIKNTSNEPKKIYIVTREEVILEPGEELEFDGDIELGN